ncbi:MAG: hypothetical protein JWP66_1467 [Naasia sp.]|nr:hypothetical protein [Naasia sp.]
MTLNVLGPLDTGTGPLSPRERVILSALILRHGTSLAPAVLAEAYWGEAVPNSWAQQVKTSVARIRSRLGREVVRTVGSAYLLGVDPATIDAVRFERLVSTARQHALGGAHDRAAETYRRALGMWRGDAYPDVSSWEPGIIEAMRLGEIRAGAEEELLEERLRGGEARTVVSDAERLVREAPLREARWATLALALYRSERQGEALATLRAARERLASELGIDPGGQLQRLETAMLRHDASLAAPARVDRPSTECPYRGLRPFGPPDSALFFGRDEDIDLLVRRVRPGAVVVLAGPSGSGKSSVLLAGVLPRLVDRGLPTAVIPPDAAAAATLRRVGSMRGAETIVVLDQAEELFADSTGLEATCRAAAEHLAGGGCLLLTIRSDFLDRASALPQIGPAIARGIVLLGPLTARAVRQAIEEPAVRAGLHFEPGLVDTILRESDGRATTLPHLSHALLETWLRREGSSLTHEGYAASGGIAGAIARSAEEVFTACTSDEREVVRSLILRLIATDIEGGAVRRRAAVGPLRSDPERRRVLELLVAARLVTVDGDSVLLSHEAIASAWPRLEGWLREDSEGQRILRQLEFAAQSWADAGRREEDLARGARLHAATEWAQSAVSRLAPLEEEFLTASADLAESEVRLLTDRASRDRIHHRRLRIAFVAVAVLLVAATVAGGVAVVRGRDAAAAAEDQRIEALAATSLSLRNSDRDLAALLAAEVARRWPDDPRARSALLGTVTAAGGLISRRVFGPETRLSGAAMPGTRTALLVRDIAPEAGNRPGRPQLLIVDVDTGRTVRELAAELPAFSTQYRRDVVISGDGGTALVQTPDFRVPGDQTTCCTNHLAFLDLGTGALLAGSGVLESRTGGQPALSFDGRTLYLVHSVTGEPLIVDVMTGAVRGLPSDAPSTFEGLDSGFAALALTHDGRLLVPGAETVSVFDPADLAALGSLPAPPGTTDWSVADDRAGGALISGELGIARVAGSGTLLWHRSTDSDPCVEVEVVEARGALLCRGASGEIREYDLASGEPSGRAYRTLSDWTQSLDPLEGGEEFVTISQRDGAALALWRIDQTPPITTPLAAGRVLSGGFGGASDDIVVTANAGSDGAIGRHRLWDLRTDSPVGAPSDAISWLSASVVARWDEQTGSILEDVTTGRRYEVERAADDRADFLLHGGGPGRLAYLVEDERILPFDPSTGARVGVALELPGAQLTWYLTNLSELPQEEAVAATWYDPAAVTSITAVLDLRSGTERARGLEDDHQTVATPDGGLLSANAAHLTRSSAGLVEEFALPRSGVAPNAMQVDAGGSTLLISAYDGSVTLYDLADGRRLGDEIRTAPALPSSLPSGYLSPVGDRMVTAAADGILLWDLRLATLSAAACRLAGRALTALEWRSRFGDEPQVDACAGTPI